MGSQTEKSEPPGAAPFAWQRVITKIVPDDLINIFLAEFKKLYGMPGWNPKEITFSDGTLLATVTSQGSQLKNLYEWSKINNATVNIRREGISVALNMPVVNRAQPTNIYPVRHVIARLIDNLSTVYPGNRIQLGEFTNRDNYTEVAAVITLENVSPELLGVIGSMLRNYPITLQSIVVSVNNGSLNGSINLLILGN